MMFTLGAAVMGAGCLLGASLAFLGISVERKMQKEDENYDLILGNDKKEK